MILEKKKSYSFIKKDTIQKYITKNTLYTKKKKTLSIKHSIIYIVIFCLFAFILHIYQLFSTYKKDKEYNYLSIVPKSGIY